MPYYRLFSSPPLPGSTRSTTSGGGGGGGGGEEEEGEREEELETTRLSRLRRYPNRGSFDR